MELEMILPAQLSGWWQWQPVPDWLVTPGLAGPWQELQSCSSSAWWAALPTQFLSLLPLAWAVNSCFFCHSWVPQAAVLVVTVLSAFLGQPGGVCSLLETWGFYRWLAKISAPGQAWQKHLCSPVWPDSNDSLYRVVEMTTEQHSTSMQSPSQGNIAQSVSG